MLRSSAKAARPSSVPEASEARPAQATARCTGMRASSRRHSTVPLI